jgi:hypothetical protein
MHFNADDFLKHTDGFTLEEVGKFIRLFARLKIGCGIDVVLDIKLIFDDGISDEAQEIRFEKELSLQFTPAIGQAIFIEATCQEHRIEDVIFSVDGRQSSVKLDNAEFDCDMAGICDAMLENGWSILYAHGQQAEKYAAEKKRDRQAGAD